METLIDFIDCPEAGRGEGLTTALNLLHQKKERGSFIVETGTTRGSLGGGPSADGWATLVFGWYAKKYGGKVATIDFEAQAIEECREITKDFSDVISYYVGNSVETIKKQIKDSIDLLYLDSANDPKIALGELMAAEDKINSDTIIYIDDTSLSKKRPGGVCKGILVHKYLYLKGYRIVFDNGDQIIMLQKNAHPNLLGILWMNIKTQFFYRRALRRNAL